MSSCLGLLLRWLTHDTAELLDYDNDDDDSGEPSPVTPVPRQSRRALAGMKLRSGRQLIVTKYTAKWPPRE